MQLLRALYHSIKLNYDEDITREKLDNETFARDSTADYYHLVICGSNDGYTFPEEEKDITNSKEETGQLKESLLKVTQTSRETELANTTPEDKLAIINDVNRIIKDRAIYFMTHYLKYNDKKN